MALTTPKGQKQSECCYPKGTKFPVKLHQLLCRAETCSYDDIISWSPNGCGFKVHDRKRFEINVMSTSFGSSKYRTFQKNLNMWGFTSSSSVVRNGDGEDLPRGAYSHPMFRRDSPELCFHITRRQVCYSLPEPSTKSTTEGGEVIKKTAEEMHKKNGVCTPRDSHHSGAPDTTHFSANSPGGETTLSSPPSSSALLNSRPIVSRLYPSNTTAMVRDFTPTIDANSASSQQPEEGSNQQIKSYPTTTTGGAFSSLQQMETIPSLLSAEISKALFNRYYLPLVEVFPPISSHAAAIPPTSPPTTNFVDHGSMVLLPPITTSKFISNLKLLEQLTVLENQQQQQHNNMFVGQQHHSDYRNADSLLAAVNRLLKPIRQSQL